MRYKLVISYRGTTYYGWQAQVEQQSIQTTIEQVLSTILNTPIKIYASGRTDAGVHAYGQVAHFDFGSIADLAKLQYGLNSLLPADIRIDQLTKVDDDFHARFSAVAKCYIYKINTGRPNPFTYQDELFTLVPLDLKVLKDAAKLFLGTHNFQDFTAKEEDNDNFVRRIDDISIITDGERITIKVRGSGFMRYQMRMMIGTLLEIAKGKLSSEFIKQHLDQNDRHVVAYKAPSHGLYLQEVIYE